MAASPHLHLVWKVLEKPCSRVEININFMHFRFPIFNFKEIATFESSLIRACEIVWAMRKKCLVFLKTFAYLCLQLPTVNFTLMMKLFKYIYCSWRAIDEVRQIRQDILNAQDKTYLVRLESITKHA